MTLTPINDPVKYLCEWTNIPSSFQNTSTANMSSINPTAMASFSKPSTSSPSANPTITVTPAASTSSKRAPPPNSNPYCPTSSCTNPRGPSQASTSGIPYGATSYGVLLSGAVSACPETYYGASSPVTLGPVSGYNKAAAEANGMRTDMGGLCLADKESVEALYDGQSGLEGWNGGGYDGEPYGGQGGQDVLTVLVSQERLIYEVDNGSKALGYATAQENLCLEGELRRDGLGDAFDHVGDLNVCGSNTNGYNSGNGCLAANAYGSRLKGSFRHAGKAIAAAAAAASGYNGVVIKGNLYSNGVFDHDVSGANINSPLFDLPPCLDDSPARFPIVKLEDKTEDSPKRGSFRYVCDKSSRYCLNLAVWMNDSVLHLPLPRSKTQANLQNDGEGVKVEKSDAGNTTAKTADDASANAAHPTIPLFSPGAVHNPLELVSTGTDSDFRSTVVGSEVEEPRSCVANAKSALKITVKNAKAAAQNAVLAPLFACGECKENVKEAKANEGDGVVACRPYISTPYNVTICRNDFYGGVAENIKANGKVAGDAN